MRSQVPRVLITGGAGYIGAHANLALAARGAPTLVVDNLVYGHREFVQHGEFVLADLADIEQLRLVFRRFPIRCVMHFAAYAYVGESVVNPSKYYENNVCATLNLLRVMQEFEVRTFIFSSTCAVYGEPQRLPLTEDHPRAPVNPYGQSKRMVEDILADYDRAYGLRSVCLRYFNAAGADPEARVGERHDPETHLIPLTLKAIRTPEKPICVFGTDYDTPDGSCIRDYIHVSDLAEAHLLAMDYLETGGASQAFNLGNEQGFSVRELIAAAEAVTGERVPCVMGERRHGDPPRLVGNAAKIRAELGWSPKHADIHEILETAWRWEQRESRAKAERKLGES